MQPISMRKGIRHAGNAVRGRALTRALSIALLSFCLLGSSSSLAAQQLEEIGLQQLERAFAELRAQPTDSLKQRAFFQAYPETFAELQECFVFNRFKPEELDYMAYVRAFEGMTYVTDAEKMTRLFSLMVCGYWQADAPNFHVNLMQRLMRKQPQLAFSIIKKQRKVRQILFWQYYWENPVKDPSQEQDLKLYMQVRGYDAEKRIMRAAYEDFRGELPVLDHV
nr:hypothetical protein [uncultured Porphyromonas sp.]